ncbi:MAG: type IX secretion system membrane protein PorP/SprF [Crocinitomicaceae bacterium]|nr:type IX secretion system membrane protein PorP/SprF [Crocinitomicaceae bacterium]
MKKSIILLFLLVSSLGFAQQDPMASMYFFNPLQFNSGYAGSRESFSVNAVSRKQWVGFEGAPSTQFVSIHAPIARKRIGVGANVSYDKIGSRSTFNANAHFAYHLQLNKNNLKLSFGASAGLYQNQYNFNDLSVIDPTDPNITNNYSSITPNFGFGLYLYNKRFYAGLSSPHLLKKSIDNNTGKSFSQQHLFLALGYVHPMNSVIDLKPSVLVRYTENSPITADINVSAFFYKKFWTGVMYRMNESVGVNLGIQLIPSIMLGYSYDFPVNQLIMNQWGSHEFALIFDFKNSKSTFISPRYF